ncbi:MAG: CAP domain-containing protein [Deltaproteobacteria bacterium]|nr:CAP domain-containing protein [Deltaproteobacteria bacterium]
MRSVAIATVLGLVSGCGEDLAANGGKLVGAGTLTNTGLPTTSGDVRAAEKPRSPTTNADWATATRSPWPAIEGETRDAREIELARLCGRRDGALERVAARIAEERARGLGSADADTVALRMRAAGEPHVRPKVVVATGQAPLDETGIRVQLARGASNPHGERGGPRCAVAIAPTAHGGEVLVAIMVEALADLAPIPLRGRTGEWLSFDARIHATSSAAKLVILPPHGLPRTYPTTVDPGGMARSRFSLDQPGAFTVQLVADLMDGPRPVLEAKIFADVEPGDPDDEPAAPGEEAAGGAASGDVENADALMRMVTALRASEKIAPLSRHPKLDAIARAHAAKMRDAKMAVHDAGDGDPSARLEADPSLHAKAVGENVARATSITKAHRALHASPSHRLNLLRADYTHIGVGVATGDDGTLYVCETFAAAAGR